jgi:Core-2/I-Branching enzyme
MKTAFLIMAYKDPSQIERLIHKFSREGSHFYIHLDKKIDKTPFEYLGNIEGVYFIEKRVRVNWGGYSLTAGIIHSIKEISSSARPYDFVSVMSGQDYPIKPVHTFYDHLERNPGKNFIFFEEPGEAWWSHASSRIHQYHMTSFGFRGRYRIQFFINRILPRRKFPLPYKMYGGPCATFMTITSGCAKYVVDFMDNNKRIRRFAFFSWGTDEFLIPTIIMNSCFKDSVINDNLYYIDWSKGGSNPKTFTTEDIEAIKQSDKLLARKFDIRVDTRILDLLDEAIS